MRRSVDLPQPEGPTRTRNSPSAISSETSSTAVKPVNSLTMCSRWMAAIGVDGIDRSRDWIQVVLTKTVSKCLDCPTHEAADVGSRARRRRRSSKATSRSSTAASRAAGSRARAAAASPFPGFVDLQVNGFGGVDFLDADCGRLPPGGRGAARDGRHRLPADADHLARGDAARRARRGAERAGVPAHPRRRTWRGRSSRRGGSARTSPASRRDPDLALLERLLDGGPVRTMTLAPELPGASARDRAAARARRDRLARATATRPPSRRTALSTSASQPSRISSTRCGRSCTATRASSARRSPATT